MTYKTYIQNHMTSALYIVICVVILTAYSTHIQAKKRVTINQKEAFPSMDEFYADDPQRNLKLSIEEMMGLYLVDPPRRHKSEATKIKRSSIHFHLWYPVAGKDITGLLSTAMGWLILGRTQYASGAQGLFSDLPDINRISLTFHEVYRPDKNKKKNIRHKVDTIYPYLLVSIRRQNFEQMATYVKNLAIFGP